LLDIAAGPGDYEVMLGRRDVDRESSSSGLEFIPVMGYRGMARTLAKGEKPLDWVGSS
jgi:hypothetical protein